MLIVFFDKRNILVTATETTITVVEVIISVFCFLEGKKII